MAPQLFSKIHWAEAKAVAAAYAALSNAAWRLTANCVFPFSSKFYRALVGRKAATERWLAWARQRGRQPLVWIHASSVGEIASATPVIERLRTADPELRFVLSYSSPSAAGWNHHPLFEHADYVPPDDPGILRPLLAQVAPTVLVFSRGDLWPGLVATATALDLPVVLVAGAVSPHSFRLKRPLVHWLGAIYSRLAFAGASTRSDAIRLARLGIPRGRIAVTGDPRHNQVIERQVDLSRIRPLREWAGQDPVIVAGSTHQADERLLARAFALARQREQELRLVLVPHESQRAEEVARILPGAVLWSGESAPVPKEAQVVVVGRPGLLADLYLLPVAAHVGGGFERSGVHSVAEPAAFALPLSFGPRYRSSPEATAMVQQGTAACIPTRHGAEKLVALWGGWIADRGAALRAGLANRRVLRTGAAGLTASALLELIRRREPHSLRRSPSEG